MQVRHYMLFERQTMPVVKQLPEKKEFQDKIIQKKR